MSSLWAGMNYRFGTDVSPRNDIALRYDNAPLQRWGLSSRTLTALLRYNIKMTVGDVIRADDSFTAIEKLGTAGLNELDTKVSQLLATSHGEADAFSPSNQSSILTNSKTSLIAPLKVLPEAVQNLPLDQLHLEEKAYNALLAANITTIGELDNASSSLIRAIRALSANELGSINSALIVLYNSVTQENAVDWFLFWKDQGIQLILSTYSSSTPFEAVLKGLPAIIEEVLNRELDKRAGIIIGSRLGLGHGAKLKLEEIGNALGGISRERVRQIEEKALRVLREVFVEQRYRGRNYHVHPYIHLLIRTIHDLIEAAPNMLILETKLQESLCQQFNIDDKKIKAPLNLILSLLDVQHIEFDYPNAMAAWGYVEAEQRTSLENWIKRLDDLLTWETPLPLSELKILAHLNKKVKKSEVLLSSQLKWLIDLCNTVERCEDGSVWGKFEYLKGRGNQVERLLTVADRPMSVADITREVNHRLVPLGQRPLTDANLTNQIINDGRFVSIGRSGQWGLKSWTHINTNNILKLMEQYLIIQNRPATVDEIYLFVSERRPVRKNSIILYLTTKKERFVKVGRTTWGLAKWSDTTSSDTWNTERIADFVATIFKQNKVKELDYQVIKQALIDEIGISAKQAQGLLAGNPVIKTHRGTKWNERRAVYQSNYKDVLAQAKTTIPGQKVSLRQLLDEAVRSILETAPDKQMSLSDLMKLLQKQIGIAESTFYNYINQVNFVEWKYVPNSRKKICRLKDTQISPISSRSGTLRDRVNKSVRTILEAAPNKQIPLDDLIKRLLKEYRRPKATLYHYIADLDYVERLDIPNSHAKLCRLKEVHVLGVVVSDTPDHLDELIQQVRELQPGDGKVYEGIVKNILEYCFRGEFDFTPFKVQEQVATYNGKRIRDFIIDNRNPKMEFWRDLKHVRRVEKILFDAKNYKDPIIYSEITSTLRYLHRNKAFGNFAIIISRRGVKDLEEFIEAYSDHDEIVLFLNDEDLMTMINLKRVGKSPTSLIDQKYHEFLGQK